MELGYRRLHAIDQLLIGRAIVRSAGSGRIVAIITGRRRTWLEVLRLAEVLPDQLRADRLPILRDQAAIGLIGKPIADACDRERITHAQQDGKENIDPQVPAKVVTT